MDVVNRIQENATQRDGEMQTLRSEDSDTSTKVSVAHSAFTLACTVH